MQWLNDLPFGDNPVVKIGILAVCGIAALVVLAIIYRLVFAHRLRVPGARTRQPRLGLVDAFSLDGQRQLVLVRRDNVEHLVMIGGPNDVLVESQINRVLTPARESNSMSPTQATAVSGRSAELAAIAPQAAAAARAQKTVAPPASPVAPPPAAPVAPPPRVKSPPPSPAVSAGDIRSDRSSAAMSAPPSPAPPPAAQAPHAVGSAAPNPPPIPAKVIEPAQPIPPSEREPRSARLSMPPPIPPAGAATSRGTVVRPADGDRPGAPPIAPVSAITPSASPDTVVVASRQGKVGPEGAAPKPEMRPPAAGKFPAPSGATPAPAPAVAKTERPTAAQGAATLSPGRIAEKTSIEKPPPKVDDPFSGLDSLEAEMARLLGREKPS